VVLLFKTNELRATLEPLCLQVLGHFQLPAQRLLCYFDDADPPDVAEYAGRGYRGLFVRIPGVDSEVWFPEYVRQHFIDNRWVLPFDNLIYLPGRTCLSTSTTATVITFGHELQHFFQHRNADKVLRANTILTGYLLEFDPDTTVQPWNLPHEQDAMIASKRLAETVLGAEVVGRYVKSRIDAGEDVAYRGYFQGLSPSADFDLLAQTVPWVERYRTHLVGIEQREVDFSRFDWWV
jgi:hypothetical protein